MAAPVCSGLDWFDAATLLVMVTVSICAQADTSAGSQHHHLLGSVVRLGLLVIPALQISRELERYKVAPAAQWENLQPSFGFDLMYRFSSCRSSLLPQTCHQVVLVRLLGGLLTPSVVALLILLLTLGREFVARASPTIVSSMTDKVRAAPCSFDGMWKSAVLSASRSFGSWSFLASVPAAHLGLMALMSLVGGQVCSGDESLKPLLGVSVLLLCMFLVTCLCTLSPMVISLTFTLDEAPESAQRESSKDSRSPPGRAGQRSLVLREVLQVLRTFVPTEPWLLGVFLGDLVIVLVTGITSSLQDPNARWLGRSVSGAVVLGQVLLLVQPRWLLDLPLLRFSVCLRLAVLVSSEIVTPISSSGEASLRWPWPFLIAFAGLWLGSLGCHRFALGQLSVWPSSRIKERDPEMPALDGKEAPTLLSSLARTAVFLASFDSKELAKHCEKLSSEDSACLKEALKVVAARLPLFSTSSPPAAAILRTQLQDIADFLTLPKERATEVFVQSSEGQEDQSQSFAELLPASRRAPAPRLQTQIAGASLQALIAATPRSSAAHEAALKAASDDCHGCMNAPEPCLLSEIRLERSSRHKTAGRGSPAWTRCAQNGSTADGQDEAQQMAKLFETIAAAAPPGCLLRALPGARPAATVNGDAGGARDPADEDLAVPQKSLMGTTMSQVAKPSNEPPTAGDGGGSSSLADLGRRLEEASVGRSGGPAIALRSLSPDSIDSFDLLLQATRPLASDHRKSKSHLPLPTRSDRTLSKQELLRQQLLRLGSASDEVVPEMEKAQKLERSASDESAFEEEVLQRLLAYGSRKGKAQPQRALSKDAEVDEALQKLLATSESRQEASAAPSQSQPAFRVLQYGVSGACGSKDRPHLDCVLQKVKQERDEMLEPDRATHHTPTRTVAPARFGWSEPSSAPECGMEDSEKWRRYHEKKASKQAQGPGKYGAWLRKMESEHSPSAKMDQ